MKTNKQIRLKPTPKPTFHIFRFLILFALLTGGASVGDTLQQLECEYDADREKLQSDLVSLIGELSRHELIEIVASRAL